MHCIINGCVLTDILYSYILDNHIGLTNVKKIYRVIIQLALKET